MFTEKIKNWKQITAGFAIFGFILSFVIGLFGGVIFGIILLRAFIFALVFSGISILIMVLVDSFIPELIDSAAYDEDDLSESAVIIEENEKTSTEENIIKGRNLDITIEDEDSAVEFESAGDPKKSKTSGEVGTSAENNIGEESAAELVEELEEIEAADISESISSDSASNSEGSGDNSELPDIGDFAESFTPANAAGMNDGLSSIDGAGRPASAEIMGDMHDTEDIVKAVQTVLKKDQEG